jgi:hypothetical protein
MHQNRPPHLLTADAQTKICTRLVPANPSNFSRIHPTWIKLRPVNEALPSKPKPNEFARAHSRRVPRLRATTRPAMAETSYSRLPISHYPVPTTSMKSQPAKISGSKRLLCRLGPLGPFRPFPQTTTPPLQSSITPFFHDLPLHFSATTQFQPRFCKPLNFTKTHVVTP